MRAPLRLLPPWTKEQLARIREIERELRCLRRHSVKSCSRGIAPIAGSATAHRRRGRGLPSGSSSRAARGRQAQWPMIHLDTNYLIGLAVAGSPEARSVDRWLAAREPIAASALAWTEFLNGPVHPQEVALVESIIASRIVPFDKAAAVLAAALFNKTGRRRGSRFDCLITFRG
jgi:predicted nucleic acid-binding protein